MPHDRPPEPWHSFFLEIEKAFDQTITLHCIGGFVMAMRHGLPRPTVDVDCLAVIPVGETARLQSLAGEGSALMALDRSELRPYLANPERHDLTLRLWLEMLRGG